MFLTPEAIFQAVYDPESGTLLTNGASRVGDVTNLAPKAIWNLVYNDDGPEIKVS